jgi:hypothetical protein
VTIGYASCKYQRQKQATRRWISWTYTTERKFEGKKMMPDLTSHRQVSGNEQRNAGSTVAVVSETQSKLCPFIQKPFDECYCTSTSSLYAEATIYFCGGHFRACEIYAKSMKGKENQV